MPWARSVVVCALNYNADAVAVDRCGGCEGRVDCALCVERESDRRRRGCPGAYGLSRCDAAAVAAARGGDEGEVWAECETRCYVDTGPIVERGYAERAGVGWIGKNTCVLNQQLGSWLLLGVIVTSVPLAREAWTVAAADRCGSCTRCIDACPTDALVAPRQMDASLCIAYLTIEKKGAIAEELRGKMGRQVFGCDICQDVCPWNGRAPVAGGVRCRRVGSW